MAHNKIDQPKACEVALVDDHDLVRSGLETVINAMGGYVVTIHAGNGREFIEALETRSEPAIAIVDLSMPVMNGYETLAWLRTNKPDIRTLALTFDDEEDAMVRAVRSGARGFLLKTARPQMLKTALDSLMLTGYYHSEEVHRALMDRPGLKTAEDLRREEVSARVTPREMEFIQLVCSTDEPTYEEIAARMGVHRRTVDHYRESLFNKFSLKSKTGLVLFATRHGLAG